MEFVTNTEVGKTVAAAVARGIRRHRTLRRGDAAARPARRGAGSPGHPLRGGLPAPDTRSLLGEAAAGSEPWISARHKNVVVIGGGDTGTDCVGTSVRHGCAGIELEIMNRPADVRPADNPWAEWPHLPHGLRGRRKRSTRSAQAREFAITTKRFVGGAGGQYVREAHTVRVQWEQVNGRPSPREIPARSRGGLHSSSCWRWASWGPESTLVEQFQLDQDARSNVRAEYGKFTTSVPGVFAAGDMRRGQARRVGDQRGPRAARGGTGS